MFVVWLVHHHHQGCYGKLSGRYSAYPKYLCIWPQPCWISQSLLYFKLTFLSKAQPIYLIAFISNFCFLKAHHSPGLLYSMVVHAETPWDMVTLAHFCRFFYWYTILTHKLSHSFLTPYFSLPVSIFTCSIQLHSFIHSLYIPSLHIFSSPKYPIFTNTPFIEVFIPLISSSIPLFTSAYKIHLSCLHLRTSNLHTYI